MAHPIRLGASGERLPFAIRSHQKTKNPRRAENCLRARPDAFVFQSVKSLPFCFLSDFLCLFICLFVYLYVFYCNHNSVPFTVSHSIIVVHVHLTFLSILYFRERRVLFLTHGITFRHLLRHSLLSDHYIVNLERYIQLSSAVVMPWWVDWLFWVDLLVSFR